MTATLVEPDMSLDRYARVVRDAVGVPVALVGIVERDTLTLPGAVGLPQAWQTRRETPLSHSFCQHVVVQQSALVVSDARHDAVLRDNPAIGEVGAIAYAGYPLRDRSGAVIGSVCAIDSEPRVWTDSELRTIEDVAELCSTEIILRETTAALDRSYDDLNMFAGRVSHDLKTPLTAVIGFLELHTEAAADGSLTPERALNYLAQSTGAAQRMLHTIDDLLAYASMGGTLHRRQVSLGDVMTAVVADLGVLARGAMITWNDTDVDADPTQLRTLLQNLVGNALKYSSILTVPTVRVTSQRVGAVDKLRVVDNGVGIPAHRRADVLQPLVRLRNDLPGTGLGLATCVRIAAAHGGTLKLGPTPGGGCTVTIALPAASARPA